MSETLQAQAQKKSFRARLADAFRPNPGGKRLTKAPPAGPGQDADSLDSLKDFDRDESSSSSFRVQESVNKKPVNFYNKNTSGTAGTHRTHLRPSIRRFGAR
jgi:hypothetical protein